MLHTVLLRQLCNIQPSMPHDIFTALGYQRDFTFHTNVTDNTVSLVYTVKNMWVWSRVPLVKTLYSKVRLKGTRLYGYSGYKELIFITQSLPRN